MNNQKEFKTSQHRAIKKTMLKKLGKRELNFVVEMKKQKATKLEIGVYLAKEHGFDLWHCKRTIELLYSKYIKP